MIDIMENNKYYIVEFCDSLKKEEKEKATIEKYERDIRKFLEHIGKACKSLEELTKENVIEYKESIIRKYEISSINSMFASVNRYLEFIKREDCKVKKVRVQKRDFIEEEKCMSLKEAKKIIKIAKKQGKIRTKVMIETICNTGIRVSELCEFTIKRIKKGVIEIYNKGKSRRIVLPKELQDKLIRYAKDKRIKEGEIFITKTGKRVDRSNFWREIKELCKEAGVELKKGYPHNFRHLFARCYYEIDKDIVSLSAILGHSNIETTRIYTISTYKKVMEKMKQMSRIFRE